jgi:flagellar M-ring protein FliF
MPIEGMREQVARLVERAGGRRRAAILGAGVGMVLAILGLSWWATAPEWVPAYTGVPLESVSEMTDRLDGAKVPYRLENGGQDVLVTTADLARARVALAQGGLPGGGRPGLELFDQPSWGMTDFTQRINYRRALEGELERTIGEMRGVESAKVHLAIEAAASFRSEQRPGEASVVLKLRGGEEPERAVVRGIQSLVASSVGGVEAERVAVLDDAGRLLSTPAGDGSLSALSNRQLEVQREVERHLEDKAAALLAQALGPGNARVEVAAEINFDRVERTRESVDPDGQVTASEQTSEIVPGAQGGAGSRTAATTYDNSRQMETFSGAVGGVRRLTVAVLVNDATGEGGAAQPRPEAEVQRIQTLVERAVGFDARRGDQVSVVSMAFARAPTETGGAVDAWGLVHELWRPAVTLLALLLAFVVAMRLVKALRPQAAEAGTVAAAPAVAALPAAEEEVEAYVPPVPRVPALPTMRDRVETAVSERPEVAARVIRSMLQESGA